MQQERAFQFGLAVPDGADGAGDQAEGAAGRLELGDVGQPLGEQADQLGMERVADADLLGVVRLEGPAVDLHAVPSAAPRSRR